MSLASLGSGTLSVQLDTIVAYGEGVGAVRSVGSNTVKRLITATV